MWRTEKYVDNFSSLLVLLYHAGRSERKKRLESGCLKRLQYWSWWSPSRDWLHHILLMLCWLTARFKQLEASNQLLEMLWKRRDLRSEMISHLIAKRFVHHLVSRSASEPGASRRVLAVLRR